MKRKQLLLPLIAIMIAGTTLLAQPANAMGMDQENQSTLIEKIAKTFGLDSAKVKAVFDQHREEKKAVMQKKHEEKLNALVTAGTITAEQKQAIIDQRAKMQKEMESQDFKNMTVEQRKAAMDKKKAEIDAWSQSTGIDAKYLMMRGGGHKGGMMQKPQ